MTPKIIVVAHNLRSCHNVGSLLRTCDGIGVENVFLTGYTPYPAHKDEARLPHISRKIDKQIEKTALGAQKTQKWQKIEDVTDVFGILKKNGYKVCALEQSARSTSLNDFKTPDKVALIIGSETTGLDISVLENMEFILEIPMLGKKESFNVIQATAMALYKFRFAPY